MITGLGSAFATSTGPTNAEKVADSFNLQADDYLKVLLTTFKYQSIDEPFDVTKLTEQMGITASIQQSFEMNKSIQELVALQSTGHAASMASFIDKEVEYIGDAVYLEEGGNASFSYEVNGNYEATTIEILDSAGNLAYLANGEKALGKYEFFWDGKDQNGNPLPAGNYKIGVNAKTANGNLVELDGILARGKVSGVDFSTPEKGTVLNVGHGQSRIVVELQNVASVRDIANNDVGIFN